ncbi:hypothetical protein UFOVP1247_272 [uncultured Caudovirales phage]|uniref:Uncharacterized protein n=1 Tax=uncultured Caudovirales phage TaxID=2100421 RepID=A0A6J5RJW6_9CAUD|nr:hypothetical protein UFOVP970_312 [uncultured Caudovirales phage]CAB4193901.1 hypothetical protein UFOVP1247_272 [uncultured Caudovirales phage]
MKNLKWIYLSLIMLITYGGIYYFYLKKSNECNLIVFVEGQLSIDATQVNHYTNGFTSINLCDGTKIVYPSSQIIKVVEK